MKCSSKEAVIRNEDDFNEWAKFVKLMYEDILKNSDHVDHVEINVELKGINKKEADPT